MKSFQLVLPPHQGHVASAGMSGWAKPFGPKGISKTSADFHVPHDFDCIATFLKIPGAPN